MVTYTQSTTAALMARGVVTTRTLAELDYKLEIQCRRCDRTIIAGPYDLRRMFPVATPLHEAGPKLRCAGCGANSPQLWVWVMGWTREKARRRG